MTINLREGRFITRKLVCTRCWNEHYEKGE